MTQNFKVVLIQWDLCQKATVKFIISKFILCASFASMSQWCALGSIWSKIIKKNACSYRKLKEKGCYRSMCINVGVCRLHNSFRLFVVYFFGEGPKCSPVFQDIPSGAHCQPTITEPRQWTSKWFLNAARIIPQHHLNDPWTIPTDLRIRPRRFPCNPDIVQTIWRILSFLVTLCRHISPSLL